jgi:UMP-CMP kinase
MIVTDAKSPNFQVIFILGGPGSGKGTQCGILSEKLGYGHLSAGDLLRAERQSGSELAEIINANISSGKIVPSSITVTLLKNAMKKMYAESKISKFLIDGFPRSAENVSVWEEQMSEDATVEFVLFLDCPEDVMTGRLLERAKTSGRNDDNLEVIRKRFKTFRDESMPIVDMYEKKGILKHVIADRSIEDVYAEIEEYFKML